MYKIKKHHVLTLLSALSLAAGPIWGQAVAPATEASESIEESERTPESEVLTLDPFTVTTEHEGYKADDTLAGGRVRTSLKDTPASLSVITKKLMEDLGVTNSTDLLVYTASTEVAGLFGNYSGLGNRSGGITFGSQGSAEGTRLVNPAGVNRARGLTAMDNTRNYMPSEIPWDGFNISRVDISRGPNSFLFGTGSPSGISNVSTNEATYKNGGNVEFKYGSFGSTRQSLDYNQVLLPNQLAMRLDLVNSDTKYKQKPAFNDSERVYGALRYDPEFLRTDSTRTKILASFEHGEVKSNNPRILPPVDYITGYLNDPRASDTGYDPWQYNNEGATSTDSRYSLWAGAGSIGNQYQNSGAPAFYWDAQTGTLLRAGQSGFTEPSDAGFGTAENTWNVHSVGFGSYARTLNYIYTKQLGYSEADAPYQGAYSGTVSYLDQTLRDPSVFDFYNKLIDGDNKREWQDWDAYNVSVTQSLFNDRLTVQATVDHQEYRAGYNGVFTNRTPILMLDLDSHLLSGTPTWLGTATVNPNVGRPVVFADQGNSSWRETIRDNYQVTASYDLNFERDLKVGGLLGRILGRHNFTGLWGQYEKFQENRDFKMNGVHSDYLKVTGRNSNPRLRDTNFNWLAYTGPSLLGTTGAGANLSSLQHPLTLPAMTNFNIWSNAWIADASVDPTAEWTYTGRDGSPVTATQADNPANYQGFVPYPLPIINGESNPWVLGNSGTKAEQEITSKAIMYQGHFWDDTIVPSVGYREDTTKQRSAETATEGQTVNFDYSIVKPGVEETTHSLSYGVAIHLPKAIKKNLPEGTDLTFHYFHGENETPRVRYGLDGAPLDNEKGETDDYSVQFDGLNGRLTARLTYFKTKNQNSTSFVGEPLGTWAVQSMGPILLQYAAWGLAERELGRDANGTVINAPASWPEWMVKGWWRPHSWMDNNPDQVAALEEALKTDFLEVFPQSYWDGFSYNVDTEAIRNGDWLHIIKGTDNPNDGTGKMGGSKFINGEWPTIDQDLESKGYELEITFRPMRNWDITFNGSQVDATQTAMGEGATRVLTGMADLFLGTGMRYANYWDSGPEAAKNWFLRDVWSAYLKQVALIGGEQPEQRKYRFNLISNYRFDRGALNGLNFGGAFRWEDKAIEGYGVHETEIYGEKAWIADVDAPIYGDTEEHLDLWVGYQRRLTKKIDWRVQLNVRNAFEDDRLVTVAVQPDGTTAQSRIASGTTYDLTMKFMF